MRVALVCIKRFTGNRVGDDLGPGRARLKAWCQATPNPLSSHRFFGAICRNLECRKFGYDIVFMWFSRVPNRHG